MSAGCGSGSLHGPLASSLKMCLVRFFFIFLLRSSSSVAMASVLSCWSSSGSSAGSWREGKKGRKEWCDDIGKGYRWEREEMQW